MKAPGRHPSPAPPPGTSGTLRDGRRVSIRALDAHDAEALITAVDVADIRDLYRRFLGTPLPARVLASRLTLLDGRHDLALGAFDECQTLVGVVQFDRGNEAPEAEVAIEIATGWQRVGLGWLLLQRLVDVATEAGIESLTASYFIDNLEIQKLLRRLGPASARPPESGAGWMRIDIRGRAPVVRPDARQVRRLATVTDRAAPPIDPSTPGRDRVDDTHNPLWRNHDRSPFSSDPRKPRPAPRGAC